MVIRIRGLSKIFSGGVRALQDIDLEISEGMFGLLGPNGAGKSTLMKILATLEVPSAGEAYINGADVRTQRAEIRKSLGYLPQFFGVYPQLTGAEFLTYMAKLKQVPRPEIRSRVEQTLRDVSLFEVRDRKAKTYSGGMMRRLGIAQALISDPKILIIDEPTTGLDPEERIRFRNLLAEISQNKVIILSTHIVGDISSTCNDLALLAHGKLVFRGMPDELIAKASNKVWQLVCEESDFKEVSERMQVISSIPKEGHLSLRVVGDALPGYNIRPLRPSLEDAYMYFMDVTGERIDEQELQPSTP